jgi:hypothetical protein
MTNAEQQQPTGKALCQPCGANIACAESVDVCELFVAELQARRARLQELLRLVRLEAERLPARRGPVRSRTKCQNARVKRIA